MPWSLSSALPRLTRARRQLPSSPLTINVRPKTSDTISLFLPLDHQSSRAIGKKLRNSGRAKLKKWYEEIWVSRKLKFLWAPIGSSVFGLRTKHKQKITYKKSSQMKIIIWWLHQEGSLASYMRKFSGTIWHLIDRWQFLIQSSKLNFHNSKFESSMQFGFRERERMCLLGNMIDVAFSYEFLLIQVN